MTEIFTAKTVDEAKALAAKKFGKDISEGEARKDLSSLAGTVKILIGGRKEKNE